MYDQFPPFSRRLDARPGSGRAIATSAILGLPAVIAFAGIFLLSFAGAGAHFGSKTHEVSVRTNLRWEVTGLSSQTWMALM